MPIIIRDNGSLSVDIKHGIIIPVSIITILRVIKAAINPLKIFLFILTIWHLD